jgi:MFS family permease
VLTGPALPLLKGRLPTSRNGGHRICDTSFLANPLFYCFALSNLFQGFGFFIPAIYLPSFATALGYGPSTGAIVLSANNLAQVFGQVAFGYVSDRTENVLILVFASSFVSCVAAFTLWGLAKSPAPLVVFAIIYGWFAAGFVVLWTKFGSELTEDPLTAQDILGIMSFEKGIGNILTGPVSALLTTRPVSGGYGIGKYESLIIFLGTSMFCSSLGIFGWPFKRIATNR